MANTPTSGRDRPTWRTIRVASALVAGFGLLAVSIALVIGGLVIIVVGVQDVLAGSGFSTMLAGALFAVLGLPVIIAGGLILERIMPHAVSRLSGRKINPQFCVSGRFYGAGDGGGGGGVGGGDGGGGGC